jgi:ABC-2 type transport system permease protein
VTATTSFTSRAITTAGPGFGSTLSSEWTKLRTVRSTWIMAGLLIALPIGFTAVVALVSGITFDSWGEGAQASFDPVLGSMPGLLFSLILLIVFGATAVSSEYSSGLIRTSFIVTPQRGRVLASRAIIVGACGLAISMIIAPAMFLVSQAIHGSYGLETASIADSDALRFVAIYMFVVGLTHTLIPFAIAWLLRGTASAITASIAFFFLPWMLSPILPAWLQQNVLRYTPDLAIDSLTGYTAADAATHLGLWAASVVIVVWLVGLFALAAFVLSRRDA